MAWPSVALSEFCSFSGGGKLKLSKSDYVGDGFVAYSAAGPDGFVATCEFTQQAVIISAIGARCGKAFLALQPFTTLANTYVVFPNVEIADTKFIWYQLNDERSWIRSGTAQPFIKPSDIKARKVVLPSLAEQQRIVDILDRAAAIQRLRRAAEEKAREIIPALFVDMFGDPASNPKGWPVGMLGQLASFVSGGTPAKSNARYWSGDVPWVSPKDMKVWSIQDAQDHVNECVFHETNIKEVRPGAVLIVVRGMILAHTVPIATNELRIAINQDMKAIVPLSCVLSNYLLWALRTRHNELLGVVGTAAHGTKKIDMEHLQRFRILVPPMELQRRFARIVEDAKGRIAMSKAAAEAAMRLQSSLATRLLG